jgi:hypothetical protein
MSQCVIILRACCPKTRADAVSSLLLLIAPRVWSGFGRGLVGVWSGFGRGLVGVWGVWSVGGGFLCDTV